MKFIHGLLVLGLIASAGCDSAADGKTKKDPTAAPAAAKEDKAKPGDKKAEPAKDKAGAAELKPGQNSPSFLDGIEGSGPLVATLATSMGEMKCELYEKKTPQTVLNFVGLATGKKKFKDPKTGQWTQRKFYDGIVFHRVIPKFMAQVGDPTGTGRYNPGYRFANETRGDLTHSRGAILSMANAGPGTNGSQIFITEVSTPHLDGKHTVFGMCRDSDIAVVKKITGVPTGPGSKPLTPVTIDKVTFSRGI